MPGWRAAPQAATSARRSPAIRAGVVVLQQDLERSVGAARHSVAVADREAVDRVGHLEAVLVVERGDGELTATQLSALGLVRVWQEPGFCLDLGAGMRAWWVENKVTFNPGLAAGRSDSVSADFIDPILALRAEFRLAARWSALACADIGGFDTASRLTWQVVGAVGWQAMESVSVQAGYPRGGPGARRPRPRSRLRRSDDRVTFRF